MDGPFLVRVRAAPSGWRVECVSNRALAQVELVPAEDLWRSLVTAARVLVDQCQERGWRGREIAVLGHLLSVLTRERAV